jgi:hypothetical protein
MQRVTVTVDDQILAEARQDVDAGRTTSLSAWVSDAMRRKAIDRIQFELELDVLRRSDPYTSETIDWVADAMGLDRDHVEQVLTTPIRPLPSDD